MHFARQKRYNSVKSTSGGTKSYIHDVSKIINPFMESHGDARMSPKSPIQFTYLHYDVIKVKVKVKLSL